MATNVQPMASDTPITIKVSIEGTNRKFKLPLKDLNPPVFPNKVWAISLHQINTTMNTN